MKNFFVLAPLVFAGELSHPWRVAGTVAIFFGFCFASSTVYLMNDIRDVEEDRLHPIKRRRPIASGSLPVRAAKRAAYGLLFAMVSAVAVWYVIAESQWPDVHVVSGPAADIKHVWAGLDLGLTCLAILGVIVSYLLLNVAYTLSLKRVPYIDVFSIATGFVLRVLGGSLAAWVVPSRYLLVVTFVLACFLGFGKRMHELVQSDGSSSTRTVLGRYHKRVLRDLLIATAVATISVYASYTLETSTAERLGTPWMWVTTSFTAYGVFRFLQLVLQEDEADSPTELMLRDKPFLFNLGLWVVTVVTLIYLG